VLLAAADRISDRIARLLDGKPLGGDGADVHDLAAHRRSA
jgi:hypothetical protein